ncbi:MAG: flagellar protein FlaF [Methanoculleaceae archaeon]
MGLGSVVASGLMVLLMLLAGYMLIGTMMATVQVVATAQADQAVYHEERLHTSIDITGTALDNSTSRLYVEVLNTGSEPVTGEFTYMEVFLLQSGEIIRYPYGSSGYAWNIVEITPDIVHPQMLDPGEMLNISVNYDPANGTPTWVKVITPNGMGDSTYV